MEIGQQVKILWGPYIGKTGSIVEVNRIPISPTIELPNIFNTPGTGLMTEYTVKLDDGSIKLYPPEYLKLLDE